MRVYFVRHALTGHREDGKYQAFDVPLSEKGKSQAQAVAEHFGDVQLDMLISSDSARAQETAEIIAGHVGKPVHVSSLFREKMTPSSVRGKHKSDPAVVSLMNKVWESWGDDVRHEDEENLPDLIQRAENAIVHLEELGQDNVLVVTHGTFLRILLLKMLLGSEYSAEHFHKAQSFFFPHNTGVTICEYNDSVWRLLTWNNHMHLGTHLL